MTCTYWPSSPNEFADRAHNVLATDNKYIADLEWDGLHALYPDLEKAAVGSYNGHAYFTYCVLADGQDEGAAQTPTGYGMASFTMMVAE